MLICFLGRAKLCGLFPRRINGDRFGWLSDLTVPASQVSFQGLSPVFQQMPTIGHLSGLGSPLSDTLGLGTRSIPEQDFYPGMLLEPSGD
jgi:hypothetical protein